MRLQVVDGVLEVDGSVEVTVQDVSADAAVVFADDVAGREVDAERRDRDVRRRVVLAEDGHVEEREGLADNRSR